MKIKSLYFIGIKGVGMSALALLCQKQGMKVIGSDREEEYLTDKILAKAKIEILPGFDKNNLIDKCDAVVVSAAYGEENPEVKEAKRRKIPLYYYSEFLGKIASSKRLITVTGTHGKTTTASLMAFILKEAGVDPCYLVGSPSSSLRKNANWGKGDYFVVEADEYKKSPHDNTSKLFDLWPEIIVFTSLEMDHPDLFATERDIYSVFYKYVIRLPRWGTVFVNLDYPWLRKLKNSISDRSFISYGRQPGCDWQIVEEEIKEGGSQFSLFHDKTSFGPFRLKIPGLYNVENATAALLVGAKIGLTFEQIRKILPKFKGIKRRFEYKGETTKGAIIIDDYAHHPTAIGKVIKTAKELYPKKKLWAVFQPHTYSRTKKLLPQFAQSFSGANHVILADIFASAREREKTISIQDLVKATRRFNRDVRYLGGFDNIIRFLEGILSSDDLVLVMGAGDIYKIEEQLLKHDD